MWVKILLDAIGGLLVSGAILLWIWLWEIFQDGEPWYLMANVTGIAFIASLLCLGTGVYLLRRKESKADAGDSGGPMAPSAGWSSKSGVEEPFPPNDAFPKAAAQAVFTDETEAGLKVRREAPSVAVRPAPQSPGENGRRQSTWEDGVASPGIAKQNGAEVQAILKSIALNPNDASAFNLLGTAYVHLSSYPEAATAFTRAIELGANNARMFNQRGLCYAQMGDDEQAIEDFGRAIKLDARFSDAFNNRGIAHKKLGDHRRAIEDFTSAIRFDPNFAEAHTLRGLIYGDLGGNQSKVDDFKAAARLGSAFAQQYLNEKGVEW